MYAAPPPVPLSPATGGHVDNQHPTAWQHHYQGAFKAEKNAGQVNVDDAPPHGLGNFIDIEEAVENSGIVDHDIEIPRSRIAAVTAASSSAARLTSAR